MESAIFESLPRSNLAAFRGDLERQARLETPPVKVTITITENADDTVDIAWRVRPATVAGSVEGPGTHPGAAPDAAGTGDGAAAVSTGAAIGGAVGGAAGGRLAGVLGAGVGAGAGAIVGAVAGGIAAAGGAGASGTAAVAAALRDAAARVGVDVETLGSIAFVESAFKVAADNPHSSAFGLFQFLNATWKGVVQQHGEALGVAVADRAELEAQCLMGAVFLRDNARVLQGRLGREPTASECYAAHFFGAGTAAELLAGGPDVPADQALGSQAGSVIEANRSIFLEEGRIRTVDAVMRLFDSKMEVGVGRARQLLA